MSSATVGTIIPLGLLVVAALGLRWQMQDRRQRRQSSLSITEVGKPSGLSSGEDDDSFSFPVHVTNAGPPTAGVYVVMLGDGAKLATSSGGLAIGGDAPAEWSLLVRHPLMRWRPQSAGWDYHGGGELVVELQDGRGNRLAAYPMPHGMDI